MPSILVVDDEPDLLESIQLSLETAGYEVLLAHHGLEALNLLQNQTVDLIIADIAMPELNGYQLYDRIRQNATWTAIPFIFLTARKMDSDIRYGKSLGVDDYLTKPIRAADLLAVVEGKLRRREQLARVVNHPTPASAQVITIGALRIDSGQHRVWLDENEIHLSAREFILLEYLAQRQGQVISPEELVQITHNFNADRTEAGALVRALVHTLRRKIGSCIENVRGVGYRLVVPGT